MDVQAYAALQDAFLRIVTPMKREFGLFVDVPRLREDRAYARFIVDQALTGYEPVLLDAAAHIDAYLQAADARDVALFRMRAASAAILPA
jgi:hypothetical protein